MKIEGKLGELIQRVVDNPDYRGVLVLVLPTDNPVGHDVEVFGFGPGVDTQELVDAMLDLGKAVMLDG